MKAVKSSVVLLACLLMLSCVSQQYREVIDVEAGETVEEKLEIAQRFATEARLEALKQELLRRIPNLEPEHLSQMALLWNDVRGLDSDGSTKRTVTITILLVEYRGVDGAEVIRTAADIIRSDLRQFAPARGAAVDRDWIRHRYSIPELSLP